MSSGRHLFFVGTGRCGSSISYTSLAMHPDFAWMSSWLTLLPRMPTISAVNRVFGHPAFDRVRDIRFFPKPVELNQVFRRWDPRYQVESEDRDTLASARRLSVVVDRICRAHGRGRFLGKTVGRPVKVTALAEAFPRATFVHVVRPLRPSVASLLQVEFYDAQALAQWPWRAVPDSFLEFYRSRGRPVEIAAAIVVQSNMLELYRQLDAIHRERWIELPYGEFVRDPVSWIRRVGDHAGFAVPARFISRVQRRPIYGGADEKWRSYFSAQALKNLDAFESLPVEHSRREGVRRAEW